MNQQEQGREDREFAPGGALRERREAVGITQVELGTLAHVSRTTIRNAETGMGLQARTLANLLRSLGCAAVVTGDKGNPIVPVLGSGTTRAITRVLLGSHADALQRQLSTDWEQNWRRGLVAPYLRLIDAAVRVRREGTPRKPGVQYLPNEFDAFRTYLKAALAPEELQQFDREMRQWFGIDYPYAPDWRPSPGLARGLGALLPSRLDYAAEKYDEVRLILEMDVPPETQQRLLRHMDERRAKLTAEINAELVRELSTLAEFITGDPHPKADQEPEG